MGLKTRKRDIAKRVFLVLLVAIMVGAGFQYVSNMQKGGRGSWGDVVDKANEARSEAARLQRSVDGGTDEGSTDQQDAQEAPQEKSNLMKLADAAENFFKYDDQDKIQYNEVMSGLYTDPKWNEPTKLEPPRPRDPKKDKKYSRHQCIGQTFSEDEPRVSSCIYRDICFDPKVGTFRYYKDPKELKEDPVRGGLFRQEIPAGGRGQLHGDMQVSLGVANRGHQPPFLDGFYWKPELVEGPIPDNAVYDAAPLSVLYMHYHGHNFGHMLFDEIFPFFELMNMFGLLRPDLQILEYRNFNHEYPNHATREEYNAHTFLEETTGPPPNSCAKFRRSQQTGISMDYLVDGLWVYDGHRMKTDNEAEALGPARSNLKVPARSNPKTGGLLSWPLKMTPREVEINNGRMKFCNRLNKLLPPLVSNRPKRIFPEKSVLDSKGPICFDRVLAGIGMLGEHCHDNSNHGLDPDTEDCNAGRGPLFWAFRLYTMKMMGVTEEATLCKPKETATQLQVLINVRKGSTAEEAGGDFVDRFEAKNMASYHQLAEKVKGQLNGRHQVATKILSEIPLKNQLEAATKAAVFVTISGGGANIGLYLPRGATLILICQDNKDDFVMFNHMSYVTTKWVEVADLNGPPDSFPYETVQRLIYEGIERYKDFHDCENCATVTDLISPGRR